MEVVLKDSTGCWFAKVEQGGSGKALCKTLLAGSRRLQNREKPKKGQCKLSGCDFLLM